MIQKISKTYKPFNYPWAVDIFNAHEDAHWTTKELKLNEDVNQWKNGTLSKEEKNHILQTLRLFTQSDVQVGANYYDLFIPYCKNNEIRNMLGSFANREATHQSAYALLNETLGLPDKEFTAFLEYKEMTEKIDFMQENDTSTKTGFALALAKSVFNEGVTLFASFAMLLHYQRTGKMKGMGEVVAWSIRDENIHVQGISRLFRIFCAENPEVITDSFKKTIYEMSRKVAKLEDKFIDLAYEMGGVDLNKQSLKNYIRFIADRRLQQLGLKPNFEINENPLPWVEEIVNSISQGNFFEVVVTDYSVAGLTGKFNWDNLNKFEF